MRNALKDMNWILHVGQTAREQLQLKDDSQ